MTEPRPNIPAVESANLRFRYGDRVALDNVSFSVARGEIFGLLGPNGGGKTTLFRILSTLLLPDSGAARVFGADVASRSGEVRRRIGVVFQNQSLDRRLSGRENLMHQGHLYGLSGAALSRRIEEILEKVGLAKRADERVDLLSGGLRRRVELAKGLLHRPDLLLLDEPSTGVDLRARLDFWEYLRSLRRDEGVTVLLTTHLLDEAEECDRLAIIDRGSLVAEGTPAELKQQIGGDVVALLTRDPGQVVARLGEALGISATALGNTVRFEHPRGPELVARVMEALPGLVDSVTVSHPSLDDVFVRVTGHRFEEEPQEALQR